MSRKPGVSSREPRAVRPRSSRRPYGLFAHWDHIARVVARSSHVLIFLDFDGTLVDVAPRPELVKVSPLTRRVLARLAAHPRADVFVVSGRRRREIRKLLGISGLHYYGLYGGERDSRMLLPRVTRCALRRAHLLLTQRLRPFPALWIEDKKFSLSIHLKDVDAIGKRRALHAIRLTLARFQRHLHTLHNLRDVEVLPRFVPDKGGGVREIMRTSLAEGALPFYFGDDFSDEAAFATAARGVTVRVGRGRPTRAEYRLRCPAEVTLALEKLEAVL